MTGEFFAHFRIGERFDDLGIEPRVISFGAPAGATIVNQELGSAAATSSGHTNTTSASAPSCTIALGMESFASGYGVFSADDSESGLFFVGNTVNFELTNDAVDWMEKVTDEEYAKVK